MNRARLISAAIGSVLGLALYLAHRTDRTLSNLIVAWLCGPASYLPLKQALHDWFPLPSILIGCLPSALWCFIAASLTGGWKVRLQSRLFSLAVLAPFFNAGWEVVQRLGWTDGHGDWRDAAAGVSGWLLAEMVFLGAAPPADGIPSQWQWRMPAMAMSFACIGLADVWK
jgi:hypothetical protein